MNGQKPAYAPAIKVSPDHQPDALEYVRRYYGVPAELGKRVVYNGTPATIIGARHSYIIVWRDGEPWENAVMAHPTWRMDYNDGKGWRT
mgnify:CR=1 FL=1